MAMLNFSEGLIRQHTSSESFQRGEEYYRDGAVASLVRRGNALEAEVEGSQPIPYRVHAVVDAGGVTEAACTCPYDWGGWCKHIVAALLACAHEPEAIEERPAVETMLADLDREQLQALVVKLADREPALADLIEGQVALLQTEQAEAPSPQAAGPRPRPAPVDAASFRRQVRASFRGLDRMSGSEAYWAVGGVVGEVRQVLEQAWAFIKAGDGRSALSILDAITEEYLDGWELLDDSDGEASSFFVEDLGPAWTEALLTADLTAAERRSWAKKLEAWSRELDDYGVEEAFGAAGEVAEQGWDYPPLQRVLAGEITDKGAWEGESPYYADDVAVARLNVLERQGRYREYLYLAEAEGQTERYLTMLVRVGRAEEAVDHGLKYLADTQEALALAGALREQERLEAAVRIAEHGLTLEGRKASLAVWLCDLAAGMGQSERALKAALIAFREEPSLTGYLRVQELAGEPWPEHREKLLSHLRRIKSYYPEAQVDVFLHEGLIEDAIEAVDGDTTHTLVERVAEAAIGSHPDWVIRACRKQAEWIMDEGKAEYYHSAANWLAKAREAYKVAGRESEWRAYLDELLGRHARKYKLRPMLEALKR
jgi:uncharacterized Zn finger protein